MSRAAAVMLILVLAACAAPEPRRGPPPDRSGAPPGGRSFISPAGEPFRGGEDAMRTWFDQADVDHDGALTAAEFEADHLRFFKRLDADENGVISNPEVQRYERDIAPEILSRIDRGEGGPAARGGFPGRRGGGRGGRGGGRGGPPGQPGEANAGLLNEPEPLLAADTDLDFQVSLKEWRAAAAKRFALLDADHDGKVRFEELKRPKVGQARAGHSRGR